MTFTPARIGQWQKYVYTGVCGLRRNLKTLDFSYANVTSFPVALYSDLLTLSSLSLWLTSSVLSSVVVGRRRSSSSTIVIPRQLYCYFVSLLSSPVLQFSIEIQFELDRRTMNEKCSPGDTGKLGRLESYQKGNSRQARADTCIWSPMWR